MSPRHDPGVSCCAVRLGVLHSLVFSSRRSQSDLESRFQWAAGGHPSTAAPHHVTCVCMALPPQREENQLLTAGPAFHLVPVWFCAVCPLIEALGPHRRGQLLLLLLSLSPAGWSAACRLLVGTNRLPVATCNSRRSAVTRKCAAQPASCCCGKRSRQHCTTKAHGAVYVVPAPAASSVRYHSSNGS